MEQFNTLSQALFTEERCPLPNIWTRAPLN